MTKTMTAIKQFALWVLSLAVVLSSSLGFAATVTPEELNHEIQARLFRVPEYNYLYEISQKMGVKVYLFGGTASSFAHYVRWDLLREKGDTRYQEDRFDYDYTNIYRSTQDLDIVVDGDVTQVEELQNLLRQKFKHFQGSKDVWEVRSLRKKYKDKVPLLDNPDFLNQNTDSNSTGMIEINKTPGQNVVRDLHDWNNPKSQFLVDISEGKIHYYASARHATTSRAKEGKNPEILSVIRYLIKAFQFELEMRPEDYQSIKRIIADFNPRKYETKSYVNFWIEEHGKKLVRNAVNVEYAANVLADLQLKQKLISLNNNASKEGSLAWWLSKEPLRTQPLGQGSGKTALELGITIVAHDTVDAAAFDSITRAHTGDANVFISRGSGQISLLGIGVTEGERALYGNGFYTAQGDRGGNQGAIFTVRFTVNPEAREGSDFVLIPNTNYVLFKNKAALRVIPESLNLGVLEYLKILSGDHMGLGMPAAAFEKMRRRVFNHARLMTPEEIHQAEEFIAKVVPNNNKDPYSIVRDALAEWLRMPFAKNNPELLKQIVQFFTTQRLEFHQVVEIVNLTGRVGYDAYEKDLTVRMGIQHLLSEKPPGPERDQMIRYNLERSNWLSTSTLDSIFPYELPPREKITSILQESTKQLLYIKGDRYSERDRESQDRAVAAARLGQLRTKEAADLLLASLNNELNERHPAYEVLNSALQSLRQFGTQFEIPALEKIEERLLKLVPEVSLYEKLFVSGGSTRQETSSVLPVLKFIRKIKKDLWARTTPLPSVPLQTPAPTSAKTTMTELESESRQIHAAMSRKEFENSSFLNTLQVVAQNGSRADIPSLEKIESSLRQQLPKQPGAFSRFLKGAPRLEDRSAVELALQSVQSTKIFLQNRKAPSCESLLN